jgi:endonuclease YncB( thermonuclease family)
MIYDFNVLTWEVTDGDTVKCLLDLGIGVRMDIRIRLEGTNAPEITTSNAEHEAGHAVRSFVDIWFEKAKAQKCVVAVMSTKWDKYGGRIIGDFIATVPGGQSVSLAKTLLSLGFAKPYNGSGTKPAFTALECTALLARAQQEIARINFTGK